MIDHCAVDDGHDVDDHHDDEALLVRAHQLHLSRKVPQEATSKAGCCLVSYHAIQVQRAACYSSKLFDRWRRLGVPVQHFDLE